MSALEATDEPVWVDELLHDDIGFRTRYRNDRPIVDIDTEYQKLQLFENEAYGKVLVLDGAIQLTTKDEFVYHEMMAHVPVMAHGNAKQVLIIGGGDGGIAEEVLKHESVQKCTMVEIDPGVVEFSKKHLPEVSNGVFDHPRFELVIADGFKHVQDAKAQYDVIIVDSTDPIGPSKVLFTEAFYGACSTALTDGGILITQNGCPFLQPEELTESVTAFKKFFADAGCYLCAMPTYVGGFFASGWATNNTALRDVSIDTLNDLFDASVVKTRYYTPEVHKAAFAIPPYVQDLMK